MIKRIKERYERFRQWQEKPVNYEFVTDEVQHCNNCGHSFKGNYCPYCSQKAGVGDVGWGSVKRSVMDIWGLGSRSLPNTVLQLLLRPGYLISDYISGKHQVSFPPVKMLFIVAVIVVFWIYYLLPLLLGEGFDVYGGLSNELDGFEAWNKSHFVWTYFILSIFYILPTWIMFRYSPRHTRHTLPQGFFIQIFLLVLNLIVSFLFLSLLLFFLDYSYYLYACFIVLMAYYFIAYKQLFGYGIWGTLWRLAIVVGTIIYFVTLLIILLFVDESPEINKYYYAGQNAGYSFVILAVGWVINFIVTRKIRKKSKK